MCGGFLDGGAFLTISKMHSGISVQVLLQGLERGTTRRTNRGKIPDKNQEHPTA